MSILKKISLFIVIYGCAVYNSQAQKQSQLQQSSMYAPATMKIDGKLDEWADKNLSAYNSNTRMFYVMSNDDKNLYLTIRGAGTRVSVKLLEGGLVFTISKKLDKNERKKAPDNIKIMFPVPLPLKDANYIMGPERNLMAFNTDSAHNHKPIDSLVAIANNRLTTALKEIKISGIKEITDTILSIYNENGIKASMLFKNVEPNVELAIPLKFLGFSMNELSTFSYNIQLNAPPSEPVPVNFKAVGMVAIRDPDVLFLNSTSDFWGQYTLARKP